MPNEIKDQCPYCRRRAGVMITKKKVSGLSTVQCAGCKKSYDLDIDAYHELAKSQLEIEGSESTMQKSVQQLERENEAMRTELAKEIEGCIQLVQKAARFSPEQVRKWDAQVKAQVREATLAAIAQVKGFFGDGVYGDGAGYSAISQFIQTAQGVIALLDCETVGPTGTSSKSQNAGGVRKFVDEYPDGQDATLELIKGIHGVGGYDGADVAMRKGNASAPSSESNAFRKGARRMPQLELLGFSK